MHPDRTIGRTKAVLNPKPDRTNGSANMPWYLLLTWTVHFPTFSSHQTPRTSRRMMAC